MVRKKRYKWVVIASYDQGAYRRGNTILFPSSRPWLEDGKRIMQRIGEQRSVEPLQRTMHSSIERAVPAMLARPFLFGIASEREGRRGRHERGCEAAKDRQGVGMGTWGH